MKYIFIINNNAGKKTYKKLLPKIEQACKKRNIEFEIRYIDKEKNASDIANEYKNEENVIYVVGGDGTINIALSGIIGTKNKLGIIPAGSGNDTYRTIKNLPKGETKIDLGQINYKYFINVACIGIDADVANNTDIVKNLKIPPSQIYNVSIIYTFIKYKFKKIKVKTQVKQIDDYYSILSICNGGFYGGGFNIAPKSKLTDGLFDVYYAEKMPKIKMLPLLLRVKKGKHEGKRKIHKFRTNHIEIDLNENVTFNVDGEKLTDNHFIIDIIPETIWVYNDEDFVSEIM